MLLYWLWFSLLKGISLRQKLALLERFSTPEDIYALQDFSCVKELMPQLQQILSDKDLTEAETLISICRKKSIGILTIDNVAYPARLRSIADPPLVLYYKGVLPDFEIKPAVAVVGTRKATAYGLNIARQLSGELAACGGLVVSGGAYGVDTMALKGALEAGGQTVAVLGCGVDIVYPSSNRTLFDKIEETGCLLSEYLPGTKPAPWQFPERNRIVSGISNGVLVVEAPAKSGALITARDAIEQGRDVFVVPGNIDVPTCSGSNALLREGASAVFSGWDILQEYASQYSDTVAKQAVQTVQKQLDLPLVDPIPSTAQQAYALAASNAGISEESNTLSEEERQVLAWLSSTPIPLDDLIARVDMGAGTVLRIVTKLSLKGVVKHHPGRLVSAKLQ